MTVLVNTVVNAPRVLLATVTTTSWIDPAVMTTIAAILFRQNSLPCKKSAVLIVAVIVAIAVVIGAIPLTVFTTSPLILITINVCFEL